MKKHLLKLFCSATICIGAVYWLPKFCHRETDGFQISRIYSHAAINAEIKELPPLNTIAPYCKTPFRYLGYGGQCWVFASDDGKTVLKLFKYHQRRVHPVVALLPLWGDLAKKRALHAAKREKKFLRDFRSYAIAYSHLQEETGLLYAHLEKSGSPLPVTIIDKLGIKHSIDLSKVEFLLQKRATMALDYISNCMERGQEQKAKEGIDGICMVIAKRAEKGIFDEDAKIHRNFGFAEGKALIIDVGRFRQDREVSGKSAAYMATRRLHSWLDQHYPSLVPTLGESLERI